MQITVPVVPEGKDTASWRRHLTGVDPAKDYSYRALGPWLQAGDLVEIPQGSLVLVVDRAVRGWKDEWVPGRRSRSSAFPRSVPQKDAVVTVYLAADGELVEMWSRHYMSGKSAFGATTTKKLAALLEQHPVPEGTAQVLYEARRPNRKEGKCRWCTRTVRAEAGHAVGRGEDAQVEHYEQCTPQAVPGDQPCACVLCGVEVVPYQAQLYLRRDGSGVWEARHALAYNGGMSCVEQPVASPQEQREALAARDAAERERALAEQERTRKAGEKTRAAREKRERAKREAHEREQARVAALKTVDRASVPLFDKGLGGGMRARLLEHTDTLEDGTTTLRWTVETYYEGSLTANQDGEYDEDSTSTTEDFTDKKAARSHYQTFSFDSARGRSAGRGSAAGPGGSGHGSCWECGSAPGQVERRDSSGVEGWVCYRCDRQNPDDYLLSFG